MESGLYLQNDRLRVDIADVGQRYRKTRFDWTGNVYQVTLDGKHTFLWEEPVPDVETSTGFGLLNEFRIEGPGSVEETKPGDLCIKIGVGLIRKPDEKPYDFRYLYKNYSFDVQISKTGDSVTYHTLPVECNGFALDYKKTLRIRDNTLFLEHRVKNHGKEIRFREFNHNYMLLDRQPIGPDYHLQLDHIPPWQSEKKDYHQDGNIITWDQAPKGDFLSMGELDIPMDAYDWHLSCAAKGLAVHCRLDTHPVKLVFYGHPTVVCPEVYTGIHLKEDEEAVWIRRYDFILE